MSLESQDYLRYIITVFLTIALIMNEYEMDYKLCYRKVLNDIRFQSSKNRFPTYQRKMEMYKKINGTLFKRECYILDYKSICYITYEFTIVSDQDY